MDDLHIRLLGKDEIPPMDLLLLADPSQEVVEKYIHRGLCFVGERNKQIVGEYVLIHTRPHVMELVNIAVAEKQQGRGIGKQLVLHAIETAKSLGSKSLVVGTGNSSVGQLAFYQKCGFRIVGVDRNFFTRHYSNPIYENGIQCRDMIRLVLHL